MCVCVCVCVCVYVWQIKSNHIKTNVNANDKVYLTSCHITSRYIDANINTNVSVKSCHATSRHVKINVNINVSISGKVNITVPSDHAMLRHVTTRHCQRAYQHQYHMNVNIKFTLSQRQHVHKRFSNFCHEYDNYFIEWRTKIYFMSVKYIFVSVGLSVCLYCLYVHECIHTGLSVCLYCLYVHEVYIQVCLSVCLSVLSVCA